MKRVKAKSSLIALALTGLTGLASCAAGRTIPLASTPGVPAAAGEVEAKRTDNRNTEVEVTVEHLAPPERVAKGATTYVVWARPLAGDAKPQNLGAMSVNADREGSLKTKTAHESFELLITPEKTPTATSPSNDAVLKATVRP